MMPRTHRECPLKISRIMGSRELLGISKNWPNSWARRELYWVAMTGKAVHCQTPTCSVLILLRGGAIVYRVALWYPDFVSHLFSVCVPFQPPSKEFRPFAELVKTRLPNFTYQLQLGSGEIEKHIASKEKIKQLLNGLYGGRGPNGEVGFIPEQGVLLQNLPKLDHTRLLSEKVGHTHRGGHVQF